jgi:D-alanine-D-alanine ligase
MSALFPKVGVFLGGPSSEHDISLKTGTLMLAKLDRDRFDPAPIYVDRNRVWHFAKLPWDGNLEAVISGGVPYGCGSGEQLPWRPDLALLGLHGTYGEDGQIQRELAALRIAYTGSGPAASQLAMNKEASKGAFRRAGLPVAPSFELRPYETPAEGAARIAHLQPGPWIVKPRDGGSSIGLEVARTVDELAKALEASLGGAGVSAGESLKDGPPLIEPFIAGRELTCGVLEDPSGRSIHALPPTEIIPNGGGLFDYTAKYTPGASQEITPARITPAETHRIQELAIAAHELLGCSGYSRSDFILSPDKGFVLLETNTLPGMTETSLIPQAAAAVGISYPALLTRILSLARK